MKSRISISERSGDLGERKYQMQMRLQLLAGLSQGTPSTSGGALSPITLTDRNLSFPGMSFTRAQGKGAEDKGLQGAELAWYRGLHSYCVWPPPR